MVEHVSRFRLYPTSAQEVLLLQQCGHARYVGNLGLEQRLMWRRWKGPTPGYTGQAAQLTQARAENSWLAEGSQTVQQQALRDLDQAWRTFFAGTHARPRWRKRGQHEGFRIVGAQALRVRQDNRRWSAGLGSDARGPCRTGSPIGSRGIGPGAGISRSPRSLTRSRHPGPVPLSGWTG